MCVALYLVLHRFLIVFIVWYRLGWLRRKSKCCAKILQCHHKRHGFARGWVEPKGQVESLGLFRNGMNHDTANADGIGGIGHPPRTVTKQRTAKPAPLVSPIHGKAGQYHDRDGVRHVAAKPASHIVYADAAGSKGVIADYLVTIAHDESP